MVRTNKNYWLLCKPSAMSLRRFGYQKRVERSFLNHTVVPLLERGRKGLKEAKICELNWKLGWGFLSLD